MSTLLQGIGPRDGLTRQLVLLQSIQERNKSIRDSLALGISFRS